MGSIYHIFIFRFSNTKKWTAKISNLFLKRKKKQEKAKDVAKHFIENYLEDFFKYTSIQNVP